MREKEKNIYLFLLLQWKSTLRLHQSVSLARRAKTDERIFHDSLNTRLVFQTHELKIVAHVAGDDDTVNVTWRNASNFIFARLSWFVFNQPARNSAVSFYDYVWMSVEQSGLRYCILIRMNKWWLRAFRILWRNENGSNESLWNSFSQKSFSFAVAFDEHK